MRCHISVLFSIGNRLCVQNYYHTDHTKHLNLFKLCMSNKLKVADNGHYRPQAIIDNIKSLLVLLVWADS